MQSSLKSPKTTTDRRKELGMQELLVSQNSSPFVHLNPTKEQLCEQDSVMPDPDW
jgi:hypothetical protein